MDPEPRAGEDPNRRTPPPDAVVFDLDGVVTFTARLHFAAWKDMFDAFLEARADREGVPFQPFTEAEYRAHVDGRPRYDGVRTFLASREIVLPEGELDDPPERETVRGLGYRKNEIFRQRVLCDGVEVDPEAIRLAKELRASGVHVGVASSSRNTALVLESAGLDGLFDARVDGVVSKRLRLRGKPAPDIFRACLDIMDCPDPTSAVVVEDALAGVEAGRAGDFGLVLGVDRVGRAIKLREHGADWVVRGFEGVGVDHLRTWFANQRHQRPNALSSWPDLTRELDGSKPAVFLDYDGTLTPIVDRPDLARLSEQMRSTLVRLAGTWPTTIVSGRGREDVQEMVGISGLNYAGSHGFDIAGPRTEGGLRLEVAEDVVPAIASAAEEIRERTRDVPGVLVEDKTYSLAVHYRLVEEAHVPDVERAVDEALEARAGLRKTRGKKIFELRPAIDWDKGRAVLWLLEALGLDGAGVKPLYIGDDVTDEDAFRALEGRGIGILVSPLPHPTAARYSLQDPREVRELLERLTRLAEGG
jgi:alpha,alpha-trehalase